MSISFCHFCEKGTVFDVEKPNLRQYVRPCSGQFAQDKLFEIT
jgi:Cys-tRNA synthase (O-phospho-L-seryl-tRNA:Cys-tRNA synthase)